MQQVELKWNGYGVAREQPDLAGGVIFASPEEQAQKSAELLGAGALLVTLPSPVAAARGHLGELLEELVERELARVGAPSPYLAAWGAMPEDAQARLADQLFRTRTVGATGLAIAMGSLQAIASPVLTPDDSATLRWLAERTRETPLVLLVDDADLRLLGHPEPVPLAALLANDELTMNDTVVAFVEDPVHVDVPVDVPETQPEPAEPVEAMAEHEREHEHEHEGDWLSAAIALTSARGAQPLASFERLFTAHYMPLANAIAGGVDDPRALRAYEEFRRAFERSYADAFATFGATNRRPRLVMDAYDVASKQARLVNARTSHVLVVDSMRYDLGCMVKGALGREMGGGGATSLTLTGESLLWSALPTTSVRQLETFARGVDALRAPAREEAAESLRGRAAEVVRRMRVGSRELYKLDLVSAMLDGWGRRRGEDLRTALAEIAEATAEALARHISTLAPRTLVLIVGDHGFTVDRRGEIRVGGGAPEDVLMPAQAWMVGDLH